MSNTPFASVRLSIGIDVINCLSEEALKNNETLSRTVRRILKQHFQDAQEAQEKEHDDQERVHD